MKWRGVLSGILQSGYSCGYLLAAVAARVVLPNLGWRAMFWVGGLPALLALYIRTKVPESEAWQQHKVARVIDGPKIAMQHKRLVLYMVALMFLMNCLSHGTQDLYPDFLKARPRNCAKHCRLHHDLLQHRRVDGGGSVRSAIRADRTPLRHAGGAYTVAC